MKGKLVYTLLYVIVIIACGIVAVVSTHTAIAKHAFRPLVPALLMVVMCIGLFQSFKKIDTYILQVSRVKKASDIVIVLSAVGVVTGLMFVVYHRLHLGYPVINLSLILSMVGYAVAIFAPLNSNNVTLSIVVKRQAVALRNILYGCIICIIAGVFLKLNHYPGGKQLMNDGLICLVFLLFIGIYAKRVREKKSR